MKISELTEEDQKVLLEHARKFCESEDYHKSKEWHEFAMGPIGQKLLNLDLNEPLHAWLRDHGLDYPPKWYKGSRPPTAEELEQVRKGGSDVTQ